MDEESILKKENLELKTKLEDLKWAAEKTNEGVRALYNELRKKNEDLKKLDHLKSDFISTVSHELRTPLAIIREGSSLIKDKILGSITEKQDEMLGSILENIDRLANIINDLLDISKLEAGKISIRKEKVDISKIIQRVAKDFQVKVASKGIDLRYFIPDGLPCVNADSNKLIQVFTNLLGNSVKFTPKGGKISIEVEVHKEFLNIIVRDTGRGIAREDLTSVFDKFQQLGRMEGPGEKGTGLGLAGLYSAAGGSDFSIAGGSRSPCNRIVSCINIGKPALKGFFGSTADGASGFCSFFCPFFLGFFADSHDMPTFFAT